MNFPLVALCNNCFVMLCYIIRVLWNLSELCLDSNMRVNKVSSI